jgi:hypothetical protein
MMIHPDQHRLEVYVLGGISTPAEAEEIRSHLAACAGCRSLEREVRSFYEALDEEDRRVPVEGAGHRELARVGPTIDLRPSAPVGLASRFTDRAPVSWIRDAAMRYPVATGVAGGAGLLAAALMLVFSLTGGLKDTNPAYVKLDQGRSLLVVYNRDDRELWSLPLGPVGVQLELLTQQTSLRSAAAVADLDGDGRNEVLTYLPDLGTFSTNQNALKIFSAEKRLLREILVRDSVAYRNRRYAAINAVILMLIGDAPGGRGKEIFVVGNNGRSPSVVVRFSGAGEVLGSYWHFGTFTKGLLSDVDADGVEDLLLGGRNDVGDTSAAELGAFTALRTSDIEGECESSVTPGFPGKKPLHEIRYFLFPPTTLGAAQNVSSTTVRRLQAITYGGKRAVELSVIANHSSAAATYDYIFSSGLKLQEVKYEDNTKIAFDRLVGAGMLTGTIETWLGGVRDSVLVFDGSGFRYLGSGLPL